MGDFTMPSLGADMDQGTLLEWKVAIGDHVDRGDIIAVVDTEKSTVEVEVFESGTIEALLVEPGTEAEVGTPLARIRSDRDTPGDAHSGAHHQDAAPAPDANPSPIPPRSPSPLPEEVPVHVPEPEPRGHDHLTQPAHSAQSPLIRRLAAELHVDIGEIQGTGPGQRITRADVEHTASRRHSSGASPLARARADELGIDLAGIVGTGPGGAVRERDLSQPATSTIAPARSDRQTSVRRAIARLMTTSNREIPHYHLSTTIDLHDALTWLDHHNEGRAPAERVLPAAMLLRATALAAAHHPELNGFWIDDDFRPADGIQLGVAISLRRGGLVTPVIGDADELGLDETMRELHDLVTRSRQGSLRASHLEPASITVTNLGERGAEAVFGVIHPPQVGLVGFGRISDRPCAIDGLVGVHPMVTATLSADHRATDGHLGSRFLETIGDLLQHPDEL